MKYIDDGIFIPQLEKGNKIYHYTSAEGLRGICKREFWVTESGFLNDSTEFQIGTEVFLDLMRKRITNDVVYEELKKQITEQKVSEDDAASISCDSVHYGDYVLSFCLDKDSPLMWAEYSDFMGYSMEFDFQKLMDSFCEKNMCVFHGKVIYDYPEQLKCMESTFNYFFDHDFGNDFFPKWDNLNVMTQMEISDFVSWAYVVCDIYNMFYKRKCFEGEHEYRIIFSCVHDGGPIKNNMLAQQHFRVKNEVLIPFVKIQVNDLRCLESVLIGPKNKSDIAAKGLAYFFRNEKIDIKITQSNMPLRY